MARCAGVQNVSRPIVRCHEMSHVTPTMTLAEAKSTAYRNHGTVREMDAAQPSRASSTYAGVAMRPLSAAQHVAIEAESRQVFPEAIGVVRGRLARAGGGKQPPPRVGQRGRRPADPQHFFEL